MSTDRQALGARLRAAREADPYWSREQMARLLRAAADPRVLETTEEELFGLGHASAPPSRPSCFSGELPPDEEERLILAVQRAVRADLSVVESLATVLAAQRRTEDAIGSAPLLEPVGAQLNALQALVLDARGKVRLPLVNVAAQWAQFYGWLKANTGHPDEGQAWLDRALEWATEADDRNLISEVLSFKGHIAWMAGHVDPVIGLSAAAQRDRGLFPGQYAMSAAQEARGHAMAGDAAQAERKLDKADEQAAAARERAAEAPPWLYYHSPGFFELQRGLTYRYLGRRHKPYNRRALEAITSGLARLPEEMRRSEWAGEFIYQLGRTHLQNGDRDQAAALADDLTEMAERLRSDRLARQAHALR
ncbi:hypothetical protein [Thermomonospora sp. CIF 1]|uniref:hypothetical protein n=1 Tax=Thermomonospora sp. CIF 1 TaxID=1916083 RepID=UPI000A67F0C5|nr:hypothetical protein [Thermomonospora sp. CIF 1]